MRFGAMFSQNIPRWGCSWTSRTASGTDSRISSTSRSVSAILHLRRFAGDLLLQLEDAVDQRLGARRAAGHVDVYRYDLIDTLHDRVVVEHPAARGAGAHRDHP